MKKTYLLTPGPTPIPESVMSVFASPIIHHRTPEFEKIFSEVRSSLKTLFQTKNDVLILSATGTGGMEAALVNLFSKDEKVIVVNGGKFGERWLKIAKKYGLNTVEIKVQNGHAVTPEQVELAFRQNSDTKAILFQASETSTGVMMPTQKICAIAKNYGALSVCDAITACGVFDLPMDQWQIDVMITGSQKAMMIPPGLAFISLSPNALKRSESATLPKFYFDLGAELKAQSKNQTAWTPAISLIQGLHRSLQMMTEEGLQNTFKRHSILAEATRSGIKALGLEMLSPDNPSTAVTAVKVPPTISQGKAIPKLMREKYGVTITGGQDELEGKIFRLSHFGYCGIFDITTALACLELVLFQLGHPIEFGKGVGAALQKFNQLTH